MVIRDLLLRGLPRSGSHRCLHPVRFRGGDLVCRCFFALQALDGRSCCGCGRYDVRCFLGNGWLHAESTALWMVVLHCALCNSLALPIGKAWAVMVNPSHL